MSWDIDVSEKLYQRLANEIFFRILHGKYRTGDKMPSYTELATAEKLMQNKVPAPTGITGEVKIYEED